MEPKTISNELVLFLLFRYIASANNWHYAILCSFSFFFIFFIFVTTVRVFVSRKTQFSKHSLSGLLDVWLAFFALASVIHYFDHLGIFCWWGFLNWIRRGVSPILKMEKTKHPKRFCWKSTDISQSYRETMFISPHFKRVCFFTQSVYVLELCFLADMSN